MLKFEHTGSKALIGIILAFFAGTAVSQQPAQPVPGAQAGGLMQKVQQKQAEIQQLSQQLAQIQQATVEANPELADQRDELIANVDEKMVAAGHDPEGSREKIGDLQEKLQGDDLSDQESESVSMEIRNQQVELQQAQREAMQDEAILAEIQSLNENLVEAMKEQNPQAEQLIAQLQTAQQEHQALMQKAMQQQAMQQRPMPQQPMPQQGQGGR